MPAALNLYRVREAADGSRQLFLSIQRQKDQYQGIWIVSPEGKVLAGRHDYKDFKNAARELLDTIDTGLAAFGPVKPRPVDTIKTTSAETIAALLPSRGKGVRQDGSVDLALYVRQVLGGGRDTLPPGIEAGRAWLWDGKYRTDGPAVIDSVSLSSAAWRALAPKEVKPGARWSAPENVAREFTRLLTASSDQSAMPRPEDAKLAKLDCEVESVAGGVVHIRLSGNWNMVHAIEGDKSRLLYGAAAARGRAVYDVGAAAMRSFVLVFDGTVRHGRSNAAPNRTGAVAEWSAK
ncbi:MAG: hypothetical protein L0Y71_02930 [Gemmataceae bacterium]|nr:hypothetical protein [Gemmataceae bacterium]